MYRVAVLCRTALVQSDEECITYLEVCQAGGMGLEIVGIDASETSFRLSMSFDETACGLGYKRKSDSFGVSKK